MHIFNHIRSIRFSYLTRKKKQKKHLTTLWVAEGGAGGSWYSLVLGIINNNNLNLVCFSLRGGRQGATHYHHHHLRWPSPHLRHSSWSGSPTARSGDATMAPPPVSDHRAGPATWPDACRNRDWTTNCCWFHWLEQRPCSNCECPTTSGQSTPDRGCKIRLMNWSIVWQMKDIYQDIQFLLDVPLNCLPLLLSALRLTSLCPAPPWIVHCATFLVHSNVPPQSPRHRYWHRFHRQCSAACNDKDPQDKHCIVKDLIGFACTHCWACMYCRLSLRSRFSSVSRDFRSCNSRWIFCSTGT